MISKPTPVLVEILLFVSENQW